MSEQSVPSWRRRMRRWFVLALVTYLVVVIIMLFVENMLVYPRETAADHWEEPPDPAILDVHFTTANGVAIHGWYLEQPGSEEVLVICHGNGGNISYRGPTLLRFRQHLGCSALIFDYPGYGKSEGKPSESGCYDSAEAALKWLANVKKTPSERVILYGESLGGGVAVEMAKRHPLRALVLLKTFTSLPAVGQRQYRWLPVSLLMRNRFDNLSKMGGIHCPVFISSATKDEIIPFDMGKELYAAANEPKLFFPLIDEGHNDRVPDQFMTALRQFVDANAMR